MHPTLVGRVLMLINGLTNLSAHAHLMGHSLIRTMPDKRGRAGGGDLKIHHLAGHPQL